jgi:hypothetical protein
MYVIDVYLALLAEASLEHLEMADSLPSDRDTAAAAGVDGPSPMSTKAPLTAPDTAEGVPLLLFGSDFSGN